MRLKWSFIVPRNGQFRIDPASLAKRGTEKLRCQKCSPLVCSCINAIWYGDDLLPDEELEDENDLIVRDAQTLTGAAFESELHHSTLS